MLKHGLLLAAALIALPAFAQESSEADKNFAAAVADPSRPATDTERDADRKPAATLTVSGVKPGDIVADYAAGQGYFTRLFANAVGPGGHVYAVVPSELYVYPNIVKGAADIAAFNKAVYAALKPGGLYVILDHVAAPGSPANVTDTLHRIEPSVVR